MELQLSGQEIPHNENEMKTFSETEEMIAMNYQNHRLAPTAMLEPTTAKYLMDFIYFTRDDEQFRFYKKVSGEHITGPPTSSPSLYTGQEVTNFLTNSIHIGSSIVVD